MKILIDTGALIALTDADDKYHGDAKKLYKESRNKGINFFTTNFVLCEILNYLRARISHAIAVSFRDNLYKSNIIELVHVTSSLEHEAFRIFKKYNDIDFSFTDCTSFSVSCTYLM